MKPESVWRLHLGCGEPLSIRLLALDKAAEAPRRHDSNCPAQRRQRKKQGERH